MKKQKLQAGLLISLAFLASAAFANSAQAGASATISWTPPTTDEGGGTLTGLTGYRIYYDTASHWASGCAAAGTTINVSGGATTNHKIVNTLTPGQTYYFAVVATDGTNLSGCATGAGGVTEVSKRVTYSGDLNNSNSVNMLDYNLLKLYFNTTNAAGDVNRDGNVNMLDYNMLKPDFNSSF